MEIKESYVKMRLLADLAQQFIGVREDGGNNKGLFVERFQKAVDGQAQGEPWCMAMQQYLILETDRIFKDIMPINGSPSTLIKSEHCQTVWNKSDKIHRLNAPEPGSLLIWGHFPNNTNNGSGHVGVIVKVIDVNTVITVEGNTGPDKNAVVRDGDGVYMKSRNISYHYGDMRPIGILAPWA